MNKLTVIPAALLAMSSTLAAADMKLTSDAFINNQLMPAKFATTNIAGGKNISPGLKWIDPPEGTKSFVITCVDIHKIANNWLHWMVLDIPASVTELPEGASPAKVPEEAKELKNSFGDYGWGGPQPPSGTGVHDYIFTVYALSVDHLELEKNKFFYSERDLLKLIEGKELGKARLKGKFSK